jgi:outer membrane protein assembly factor BamB
VPSRRAFLAAIGSAGGVALAGCLGRESVSGSWPRPGFDPARTGHAPDVTGPASTPTTRWTARFPDRGVHTVAPALVDDAVLVASEAPAGDGTAVILRRFDATDGTATLTTTVTRYDDRTSSAVLWNSLVADDRGLYLVAFDGVHALTRDGERRWHRPLGGGPATSIQSKAHPLVDDDTVYVPTAGTTSRTGGDEALYALDAADGTERWRHQPDADDFGWTFPPAAADGTCYLSALEHAVTAHDPATGEVLWETRLPANGPPTVADGRVFVSVEGDRVERSHVVALDAETGEERWRTTGGGTWLGRSVGVADGRVYHREHLSELVARDAATGDEVWRRSDFAAVSGAVPTVTADALYVPASLGGDDDAALAVLDPATGERLGAGRLGYDTRLDAAPAFGDGLAFLATGGTLRAFEACDVAAAGRCLF